MTIFSYPYNKNKSQQVSEGRPFDTVEEAWFWFMAAHKAKLEGAKITSNLGNIQRPCEPNDILAILDRLFRNRLVTMDHLRVLRFYGNRGYGPDKHHTSEKRAWYLWREAFAKMRPSFERKGIIRKENLSFFDQYAPNVFRIDFQSNKPQLEGAY